MSDQPDPVSLHAVIRGRVQGVGFRDFVITRASALGLAGYVRNQPDGRSVEVVAEGSRRFVERLLEQIRDGPRGAQIESVETHWGPATGLRRDFGARF